MKSIKIELKWAVIFTILSLLWMLLEKMTGLHDEHIGKHMYYTNLFAIPAILVYVFALKDKKNNFFNGKASFKQLFLSGIIMSLMIALFAPLSTFISVEYLSPEYFSNAISMSVESKMMSQIEAEEYFNTANYMLQNLMFAPVLGVLTTLVISFILKSKS